jgi:hypothetical protein
VAGRLRKSLILVLIGASLAGLVALLVDQTSTLSPGVRITGPERIVFDWDHDACEAEDIPDAPLRAFRDYRGLVQGFASMYINRRFEGKSLDDLRHPCAVAMRSGLSASPATFDDREWIGGLYTLDGKTVHTLVHDEYQGHTHPGMCRSGMYHPCWYNSVTYASSKDGGRTFSHTAPPTQLVAALPYRYEPDKGPFGLFAPSNIVKGPDGAYYAFIRAERYGEQPPGACLLRTSDLSNPRSWRAWDGDSFSVSFANPYVGHVDPAQHVCEPVAPERISGMTHSLTYNTYLKRYVLAGPAAGYGRKARWGFFFSTSTDLRNWSPRQLITEVELQWTYRCGDKDPLMYPSFLDPKSSSRNFETVGKHAFLYYTRIHMHDCKQTLDRDLLRVPVEFSR